MPARITIRFRPVTMPAFQPEDLLRQAQIQDVALSPDGSTVVYSRRVIADNAYRTHLWIVPWSGGEARQLTHAAVNDTRPRLLTRWPLARLHLGSRRSGAALDLAARRWRAAPGGRHRGRRQGRALVARWAAVADRGAQRRRAPGRRRSGRPDCAGHRRLRLEARRDRAAQSARQRVGGAQLDGGEPRRLTDPAWEVLDARWLPDGRHIAVVADAEPDAGMRRLSERAAVWRVAVDESAEPVSARRAAGRHRGGSTVAGWHARRGRRQGLPAAAVLGRQPPLRRRWRRRCDVSDRISIARWATSPPATSSCAGRRSPANGSTTRRSWRRLATKDERFPIASTSRRARRSPLVAGEIVCNAVVVAGDRIGDGRQ